MELNQVKKVYENAENIRDQVHKAVLELTKDNPLEVFNPELIDDDSMYDMPYAYYVSDNNDYNEGRIQKVHGDDVTLYLTGDDNYRNEWSLNLYEVPFDSLVAILEMLIDREEM